MSHSLVVSTDLTDVTLVSEDTDDCDDHDDPDDHCQKSYLCSKKVCIFEFLSLIFFSSIEA